jgi:hypothetical protein
MESLLTRTSLSESIQGLMDFYLSSSLFANHHAYRWHPASCIMLCLFGYRPKLHNLQFAKGHCHLDYTASIPFRPCSRPHNLATMCVQLAKFEISRCAIVAPSQCLESISILANPRDCSSLSQTFIGKVLQPHSLKTLHSIH